MNAPLANSAKILFQRWLMATAAVLTVCIALPAHAVLTVNGGNDTVGDSTTGLVWDHCAYGLSGATCSTGSAVTKTWAQALTLVAQANTSSYKGFSDWRLPNVNELESIVKFDAYDPSIDKTAFPSTPVSYFWTSTNFVGGPSAAWSVSFGDGRVPARDKAATSSIRLVRSGQSLAALDVLDSVTLNVIKSGAGSVSGGPINCGSTCSSTVPRTASITLTASPAANLTGWGGDCLSAGTNPTCTLSMDAAKTVLPRFSTPRWFWGCLPARLLLSRM